MESPTPDIETTQEQLKPTSKQQSQVNPLAITTVPPRRHAARNGFTQTPTIQQILPIVYFILMLIQTIILCVMLDEMTWKISIIVSYSLMSLILGSLWVKTASIDPTDTLYSQQTKTPSNEQPSTYIMNRHYCHLCETFVSKESFHCRKCQRCVEVFDHHCKWLNNCIGAKNYLEFFGLIVVTGIVLLFHVIINSMYLPYVLSLGKPLTWNFYLSVIFLVFDAVPFVSDLLLVGMHLCLFVKKKTTLQLILQIRKQREVLTLKKDLQNSEIKTGIQKTSVIKKTSDGSKKKKQQKCVPISVYVDKRPLCLEPIRV